MDKQDTALYFKLFNEVGIISQLSRALMDARLPNNLSTSHFSVTNHLIRVQDGQTPLELARAFQVPKTTMTHTLFGLEANKLVEFRPNSKDGRSKLVWLTEKGRLFRDRIIMDLQPMLEILADQLPAKEVAKLVDSLAEIRELMDTNRDINPK